MAKEIKIKDKCIIFPTQRAVLLIIIHANFNQTCDHEIPMHLATSMHYVQDTSIISNRTFVLTLNTWLDGVFLDLEIVTKSSPKV